MKNRNIWELAICDHGRRAAPDEACGVIAENAAGFLEAYPMQNIHPDPEHFFLMAPAEYLPLKKTGKVRAYYHSHATGPAVFSEPDKVISEETQLPCYLYAVETDELAAYTPTGWHPPLEGRLYMPGVNDCFSLVRDFLQTEMGIETELPERNSEMGLRGIPDMAGLITRNGFVRQTGRPQRGDVLVMHMRPCDSAPNHIGVFVGDGNFLHQTSRERSCIAVYGGMWEQITAHVLRHHTLCLPK